MPLLTSLGLVSLALAGLSGWLVLLATERPEWLRSRGVVAPGRIRQVHLDWVMMGLILIAVQVAVPDLPGWIRGMVAFGTVVNPLLFIPLAWGPGVKENPLYVAITLASFTATSGGLTAVAVHALA
ncbi:MAG: hypothetical protein WD844_10560 [Thermoleophilaceae bacterium]